MGFDTTRMADNGAARHEGHIGQARIDGHLGLGVLQVWRGQHGQKLQYAGTWRHDLKDAPQDGEREAFEQALQEGRALRFEGAFDDPGQPGKVTVTTEVRISSLSDYAYLVDPDDPRSPTVSVTVVNFRPVDELQGV